jgi:hypothetical protein
MLPFCLTEPNSVRSSQAQPSTAKSVAVRCRKVVLLVYEEFWVPSGSAAGIEIANKQTVAPVLMRMQRG